MLKQSNRATEQPSNRARERESERAGKTQCRQGIEIEREGVLCKTMVHVDRHTHLYIVT